MKKFKFEIKEMQEDGSFTGIASMYGNVDLGGDIVEKGAFTKTINEKPSIPILWYHDPKCPIGVGSVVDSEKGLMIEGKLNLEVEKGREAHSLIKQGAISGLSIGYDVVKQTYQKGIRLLKELKLWEVSIVTFPMNQQAMINYIKEGSNLAIPISKGFDLESTYLQQETNNRLWKLYDLLDTTIRDINKSGDLEKEAKIALMDNALSQFHRLFMEGLTTMVNSGQKCEEIEEKGCKKPKRKKEIDMLLECKASIEKILSEVEIEDDDESAKGNSEPSEIKTYEDNINNMFKEMEHFFKNKEEK